MTSIAAVRRKWAVTALLLLLGNELSAARAADLALLEQSQRLDIDRDLLCRVERAYLKRRTSGLAVLPGGAVTWSSKERMLLDQEERRTGILASYGLTTGQYATSNVSIAVLTSGMLLDPAVAGRRDIRRNSAFLRARRRELKAVFGLEQDDEGTTMIAARRHRAEQEIGRNCPGGFRD